MEEKNIFKGAKPGDKFLTKSQNIACYCRNYEYRERTWHRLICIELADGGDEYRYSVLSNGTHTVDGVVEVPTDVICKISGWIDPANSLPPSGQEVQLCLKGDDVYHGRYPNGYHDGDCWRFMNDCEAAADSVAYWRVIEGPSLD